MELRRASVEDLEILTAMNLLLREDEKMDNNMTENEVRKRMRFFIKSKRYEVFLFQEREIIKGYIVIEIFRKPLYIRQFFVKREFRRQGIGTCVLDMILQYFNTKEIDVDVLVWNTNAIAFYEKYGFRRRYLGMRYKSI